MPDNDTVQHENDNVIDIETARKRAEENKEKPSPKHPPMINLPPITKALLFIIIAVHCVVSFILSPQAQGHLFMTYGFVPALWYVIGYAPATVFLTPITYMALHGGWTHLFMNGAMLMAFGAGCEKWMGAKKFTIFFILCGVIAAMAEFIVRPHFAYPIIGASGALSGLFAAMIIMLQRTGRLRTGKYGIWPFAAVWIGISVIFGLFGGEIAGGNIAWIAHLGGFFGGLALMQLSYFKYR